MLYKVYEISYGKKVENINFVNISGNKWIFCVVCRRDKYMLKVRIADIVTEFKLNSRKL